MTTAYESVADMNSECLADLLRNTQAGTSEGPSKGNFGRGGDGR